MTGDKHTHLGEETVLGLRTGVPVGDLLVRDGRYRESCRAARGRARLRDVGTRTRVTSLGVHGRMNFIIIIISRCKK